MLGFIAYSIVVIGINYHTIEKPYLIQNIIFAIILVLAILVSPQLKSLSIEKDTASVQLDTDSSRD